MPAPPAAKAAASPPAAAPKAKAKKVIPRDPKTGEPMVSYQPTPGFNSADSEYPHAHVDEAAPLNEWVYDAKTDATRLERY